MNNILQGSDFLYNCNTTKDILVLSDGLNKYIVNDVEQSDNKIYLKISSEVTKTWIPGTYDYQLISNNAIIESGQIKIIPNLLYSDSILPYWKKALKAIDERLAGKTLNPANDVSVGEKRISYYSLDDLLKLRDFVVSKVAEEEGKPTKDDQKIIKYKWSL